MKLTRKRLYDYNTPKKKFQFHLSYLSYESHGTDEVYSSDVASFASTLKSSSVVVSPVTFAPLAISFKRRRMILPLRVFGSASAKHTSSGFAMPPMCAPT